MTSTNDGKDVKSYQTSGHKGKKYYLGLYNALEQSLSGSETLQERVQSLCEAWRRIHSICRHAAPSSHPILLGWLERHTACATLQSQWQSPENKDEQTALDDTLVSVAQEIDSYVSERDGVRQPWEELLLRRADWYRSVLQNPWGHPVLKILLDPKETPPDDKTIIEWLKGEREAMFVRRVHELVAQRHRQCYDMAISLVTAVMDRRRAAKPPLSDLQQAEEPKDAPASEQMEPNFESILRSQCGFTDDGWSFLVDVEFALLHKADRTTRLIELAKLTPLIKGYELIGRLQSRLMKAKTSREKKMWKDVNDVAILIAQIMIARCMVVPTCTGVIGSTLYRCARALCALLPLDRVKRDMVALATPAVTAVHLYMMTKAVHKQRGSDDMKPFICELYVRAITSGMNELEKLKLKPDKEQEARQCEQTLASWFLELGGVFNSARLRGECSLTAFSVHPSMEMFERIKATPDLPPVRIAEQLVEPKTETPSGFGSWACDSRSQTNFVKTSEHLNMKQTQQANVLSTAILNEGEALGLGVELCQDIAVLLSGPRVKTLSWDLERDVLLANCDLHMRRTEGGTRALTTELRFLHLDPKDYQHLKEEEDEDENDIYYGIEKGYEHLVEFPEPQPVAVWEDDIIFDEERTESSSDSEVFPQKCRKKKTKKHFLSSCEDEDPLSLTAEARKIEKKKERPHSKERSKDSDTEQSKERKKKPKKERSHSKDKERKKEKKVRKKKIKAEAQSTGPLSQLLGVKVERPNDPLDSDYEGKSSLASLLAEQPECNIEYDGHFSMDELKSPDRKSMTPPKALITTVNINQIPIKYEKDGQSVLNLKPGLVKQTLKNHLHSKKSTAQITHLDLPKEEPKVKTEPMSNLVGSKIMNASQIPKNVLNTSQPLQPNTLQENVCNVLKTSSSQSQDASSNTSCASKTTNKVTYELANMKETCSRMVPVKSYTKNPMSSCSLLQLQYLESLSSKKEKKQVQSVSKNTTQSLSPGYQCPIMAQTKQLHILTQKSTQSKHVNLSREHESYTRQSVIADHKFPEKPSVSHQKSFEDFLKNAKYADLSINPKKVMNRVTKEAPLSLKILKCTKATSLITNITTAEPMSLQSAKSLAQQKTAEKAPNTFLRRSYMHKSKQNDTKPKQILEQHQEALQNQAALKRSVFDELEKRTDELRYKNAKSNKTSLAISKVGACTKPKDSLSVDFIKWAPPNLLIDENAYRRVGKDKKAESTRKPSLLKSSALSEKDQQDLINMLRQINKLNEPARQTKIDTNTLNRLQLNPALTIQASSNNPDITSNQSLRQTNQFVNLPKNHLNQNQSNSTQTESKDFNASLIPKATVLKTANLIQSRIMSSQAKTAPTAIQSTSKSYNAVTKSVVNITNPKDSQSGVILQSTPAATTLANVSQDIVKIVKRPGKLRNVEKKYEQKKKNWTSVFDALRKSKTPSRAPNAIERFFDGDSYVKNGTQSLRSQRIVRPNSEQSNQPIVVNQDMKKSIQVSKPIETLSRDTTQPLKSEQTVQPKIHINVGLTDNEPVIKIQEIPEVVIPISQGLNCKTIREDDPFVSGILNSEYELIDELMDDDLRKEIEEWSVDEERPYTIPAIPRDSKNVIMSSGSNIPHDSLMNTGNLLKIEQSSLKPKDFCEKSNEITEKIVLNPKNTVDLKPSTSASNAKLQILSNEKVDIIKRPDIIKHFPKIPESQNSQEKPRHVNTTISSQNSNKLDTKNMIITVPSQPSSNMVVIQPDMPYEPYPTLHIKEAPINSNINQTYVTVNNTQTVNQIKLRTFTPVVAPILVNSTVGLSTQISTSNAPYNKIVRTPTNLPMLKECDAPTKISELNTTSVPDLSINLNTLAQVSSMEKKLPKTKTNSSNTLKAQKNGKPNLRTLPLPIIKKDDLKIYQGPQTKQKRPTSLESHASPEGLRSDEKVGIIIPSKPIQQVRKVSLNIGSQIFSNATPNKDNLVKPETPNLKMPDIQVDNKQDNVITEDEIQSAAETQQLSSILQTNDIAAPEIHHKPEIKHGITNIDLSKTCERKVLSEVQEKLAVTSSEKVDSKLLRKQRLSTDNDKTIEDFKEKERIIDRERLKKKRLALINRELNHRCFDTAIVLPYEPIKDESLKTHLEKQTNTSVLDNVLLKKPETKLENRPESPTIMSKLSQFMIMNSNTPESPGNIENAAQNICNENKSNVTLVKSKSKKWKKKKATGNVATNSMKADNDKKEKDSTGSVKVTTGNVNITTSTTPTRVSSRLRERKTNKSVLVTSEIGREINGKDLLSTLMQQVANAPIPIASVVTSEAVKNTSIPEISIPLENKTKPISRNDNIVPIPSEVSWSIAKNTSIPETSIPFVHKTIPISKVDIIVPIPIKVPSIKINNDAIKISSKLDMMKSTNVSLEFPKNIIQILSSPEDTPDELTYANVKKGTKASNVLNFKNTSEKIMKQKPQIFANALDQAPVISVVPKLVTSLGDQNPGNYLDKNIKGLVHSASKKTNDKTTKKTSENKLINVITRDENGVPIIDTIRIPPTPISELASAKKNVSKSISIDSDVHSDVTEEVNSKARKFSVNTNKSDGIPHSSMNGIIVDELPLPNPNNPSIRCVRIQMPNGKIFKATVHGKKKINFDALFEDPALKNILLSGASEDKHVLLNVQQIANNKNEIVDTRIKNIVRKPQKQNSNSEVVNLISDDEDDDKVDDKVLLKQYTQTLTTEFGTYGVKSMEEDALSKHQCKLLQKCLVKLKNCQPAIASQDPKKEVINHFINAAFNSDMRVNNQILPQKEDILNDNSEKVIETATEIINLDDSSDVDTNSKTHNFDTISELKNLLLKDLDLAGILKDSTINKDTSNNQKFSSQSKLSKSAKYKAYVESPKKQYSDIIPYDCFVKLTRCDDLVQKQKDEIIVNGSSQKYDDAIGHFESQLSRSGSLSILNDLAGIDDVVDLSDSDVDRSSPTIDIFQTITELQKALETDNPSSLVPRLNASIDCFNTALCYTDWFDTKKDIQRRLMCDRITDSDFNNIESKTDVSTDYESDTDMTFCSNVSDFPNTSAEEMNAVPSLKKLMAEYYVQDYALQLNKSITVCNETVIACKRKAIDEYNEVAKKVSKIDDSINDISNQKIDSAKSFDNLESNTLSVLKTNVGEEHFEEKHDDLSDKNTVDHFSDICLRKILCTYIVNNLVSVILHTKYSAQKEQSKHVITVSKEETSQGSENLNDFDVRFEEVLNENPKTVDKTHSVEVNDNKAVNLIKDHALANCLNEELNKGNASNVFNKDKEDTINISKSSILEEARILQGTADGFSINSMSQIKISEKSFDTNVTIIQYVTNADVANPDMNADIRNYSTRQSFKELDDKLKLKLTPDTSSQSNSRDKISDHCPEKPPRVPDSIVTKSNQDVSDIQRNTEKKSILECLEKLKEKPEKKVFLHELLETTQEHNNKKVEITNSFDVTQQHVSANVEDESVMFSENESIIDSPEEESIKILLETTPNISDHSLNSDQMSERNCDTTFVIMKDTTDSVVTNQDVSAGMEIRSAIITENITKSSEVLHKLDQITYPGVQLESYSEMNSLNSNSILEHRCAEKKDITDSDFISQVLSADTETTTTKMCIEESSKGKKDKPASITSPEIPLKKATQACFKVNSKMTLKVTAAFDFTNQDMNAAREIDATTINKSIVKSLQELDNKSVEITFPEVLVQTNSAEELQDKQTKITSSKDLLQMTPEASYEINYWSNKILDHSCNTTDAKTENTADSNVTNINQDLIAATGNKTTKGTEKKSLASVTKLPEKLIDADALYEQRTKLPDTSPEILYDTSQNIDQIKQDEFYENMEVISLTSFDLKVYPSEDIYCDNLEESCKSLDEGDIASNHHEEHTIPNVCVDGNDNLTALGIKDSNDVLDYFNVNNSPEIDKINRECKEAISKKNVTEACENDNVIKVLSDDIELDDLKIIVKGEHLKTDQSKYHCETKIVENDTGEGSNDSAVGSPVGGENQDMLSEKVSGLYGECMDGSEVVFEGVEYNDPVAGTYYVFPLDKSFDSNTSASNSNITVDSVEQNTQNKEIKSDFLSAETKLKKDNSMGSNENMELLVPEQTYSRRKLKRKQVMVDISLSVKKKRFSKLKARNIDIRKLSNEDILDSLYIREFTGLLEYCSDVKFSYSISFHKDQVDVENIHNDWPIKGDIRIESQTPKEDYEVETLFKDLDGNIPFDSLTQTLTEELSSDYLIEESCEADDSNFNMGFGEGSGRVNQNLRSVVVTKFSAATLSDVKHSQPFSLSEDYDDCCNQQVFISRDTDQIEKIKRSIAHIKLHDKVRSFFKKTALELNRDIANVKETSDSAKFLSHVYIPKKFQPEPADLVVQVVQVGQLPVSAAAQNPVTCDPRVTQVSDASPSQCSEENSPRDDSQQGIKNEYTELTTADLSMPMETYQNHNQTTPIETEEAKTGDNIPIETELIKSEVKIELVEETSEDTKMDDSIDDTCDLPTSNHVNNINYSFDTDCTNASIEQDTNMQVIQPMQDMYSQQKQNGAPEKTDQIAHAMNAAGIFTTAEPEQNTRAQALVNIISQKIRHSNGNTAQNTMNTYSKSSPITAVALQQALAQILPPPLNQTNASESNHNGQNPTVTSQVLHILQGNNASGNQIALVDNSQQNATSVLHILQNKGPNSAPNSSGNTSQQQNTFSGLSLVDTGLQQGGNQLLHIVNTGNQNNTNTGQLLKRVNLLTNLTNVPGANDQKMVQFVCKSADGKSIQLNAPHQRSMVLRLHPIESPNVQPTQTKPMENQDTSPLPNTSKSGQNKESIASQQEIKSRSMYEENYAKFIQSSTIKPIGEKSTSLPKFNQAFGKSGFQDGNQKPIEISPNNTHLSPPVNTNNDNTECPPADNNSNNLEHINQMSSPPLFLRKSPPTSQPQQNLVQQIKQNIAPVNIQTMHGGVIYTRQIPVNIGGGQTINLITVPSTELIDDKQQPEVKFVNQSGEMEPSIIKIVPQSQPAPNTEMTQDESNNHVNVNNDNAQNSQPQPVLTQMRIKLPMLSKTPQVVSGARVVRPSFFQIQRNVIGGANQQVYQQLVLTAAPPLGQQTIRLPQAQTARPVKVPSDTQSSPESQMSSSTLEQLREFDMVLEQVKERSTVQPNTSGFKLNTTSSDATDSNVSGSSTPVETSQPVLYSIGGSQHLNVAYVNRKATVVTPSTSTFVRSPDSSSIADSPNSSNQAQTSQSVSNEPSSSGTSSQSRTRISSKSKSRPKSSSHSQVKMNSVPPKPTTQKPLEDEQTTQRILYILAEYKEQVENSPDKDKPAPRRRSNPPSNPGSSKRKKSSSGSRRSGARDLSPVQGDDTCRTMGSEDSSCGTSQGDCTESCMETHSPQDSPRKVARKLTFEQETAVNQPRPQPQRNVIVADGQTITVARAGGKPATAVLMPANYILPVSMVKGGQQIAIVTNRGPKLLTVGGGEGGATNALLLQRLIGPAGLKPVLARPGVRHVRLPTAALHNLQTFNLAPATTAQPPDSTASPAPAPTPPELIETRSENSPWTERESESVRSERPSSPEGSEPWNMPTSSEAQEYSYEETVRAENMDRTVLDPIPDRYSPDMEAQRIFDKMFDVESKKCFIVDSHDEPHCGYVDASEDEKGYQVVQKKEGPSHRQHRVTHISAAALRHKYAILEHELRLQKSLSEECEDLGVDSPSASELFPEAELLFAASPAQDPGEASHHNPHTPQPTHHNQAAIQPDIDDQIATDQLIHREEVRQQRPELDVHLGLGDVGMVTVSEDGMQATIALDQEEFARSHPNTTFHSEPTDGEVQQPFTLTSIKGGRQISTIFHANRVPATVLMTAPQAAGTVISQTAVQPAPNQGSIKYSDINHMILPGTHNNNVNLNSVLVKDDGLTRYDNILTDSRELHLSNTASAIIHPTGNATQVIRRVCYQEKRERDARYLIDEPDTPIAGDDAKMVAEDSSRDATMESMAEDVDDDNSSPERHTELFWESNSASERSESRRPLDFSSDSEKGYDETNSTDSSGVGSNVRHDSVIKEARFGRSGSAEGSSADDMHPPLRTYPPKRMYHNPEPEMERSLSGKTRAGEHSPDLVEGRRRTSVRGVVKRGCHCCNGSPTPAPPRSKKPRQRKPTLDFNTNT